MDQTAPVEMKINDGQKLIDTLKTESFDVTAACWVKDSEDEHWFLYIVSTVVDDKGLPAAYRDLHAIIRGMPASWIDPFEVKLISPTHGIAVDVSKIQRAHAAPLPTVYHGSQLGNLNIDEALIYPN